MLRIVSFSAIGVENVLFFGVKWKPDLAAK